MENSSKCRRGVTETFKGEVWLAYDKKSKKARPFLVMSEELTGVDVDITVAPTTTHEKRNKFDIDIEFWEEAGLTGPSVARCSKIHYIHYIQLIRKLGRLNEKDLLRVNDVVRAYLGL